MFEQVGVAGGASGWGAVAAAVAEGMAAPFDAASRLAALSDADLLGLDQDEALAVVEVTQALLAATAAVQALAVEAFTRREQDDIDLLRAAYRASGTCQLGIKDADDVVPSMLAPVLHLAPRTVFTLLDNIRTLVNDLPVTLGLARAGRLEATRARAVAVEAGGIDRGYTGDFERELYAKDVTGMAHASLAARAARTAVRVDPGAAAHRARDARRERQVTLRPGLDPGMSRWEADQPAETSLQAWAAIEALASQYATADPTRTIGAARADAMMDLILARATITATIDLVVPAPTTEQAPTPGHDPAGDHDTSADPTAADPTAGTATGGDPTDGDPTAGTATGGDPTDGDPTAAEGSAVDDDPSADAEAIGGTAIGGTVVGGAVVGGGRDGGFPAFVRVAFADLLHRLTDTDCVTGGLHRRAGIILNEHLSALLADPDTTLRLHTADPGTGQLTRHDPTTYRPGAALARAVRARDGVCRFPGCRTPAERCHLDHVTPFPHGPTTPANLAALCPSHHAFKHHAGWALAITPDGTCRWTSPLDRTYTTHPQDHRDVAA